VTLFCVITSTNYGLNLNRKMRI